MLIILCISLFYSEFPAIFLHYTPNYMQARLFSRSLSIVCTDNTGFLRSGHIIIEIIMLTNHSLDHADHFVTFHPCMNIQLNPSYCTSVMLNVFKELYYPQNYASIICLALMHTQIYSYIASNYTLYTRRSIATTTYVASYYIQVYMIMIVHNYQCIKSVVNYISG